MPASSAPLTLTPSGNNPTGQHLLEYYACPECHNAIATDDEGDMVFCRGCGSSWPVHEEVVVFAEPADLTGEQAVDLEWKAKFYESQYDSTEAAENYHRKYRASFRRRRRTRTEYRLLERLLERGGHCETLLELPCGGGRITPLLARHANQLFGADIALSQVLHARNEAGRRQGWMTASAFRTPFPDEGVDAAVCVRLSHHLHTPEQRDQLLAELLRVSRRFVIISYTDRHSPRNRMRRLVRGLEPKDNAESSEQLAEVAAAHGARLVANPAVSLFGSCHRFALLIKP